MRHGRSPAGLLPFTESRSANTRFRQPHYPGPVSLWTGSFASPPLGGFALKRSRERRWSHSAPFAATPSNSRKLMQYAFQTY